MAAYVDAGFVGHHRLALAGVAVSDGQTAPALEILTLEAPDAPALWGRWTPPEQILAILMEGSTVFAAGSAGLYVLDASSPTLSLVATLPYQQETVGAIALSGTTLYIGHSNNIAVVDVAELSLPTLVRRINWEDRLAPKAMTWYGGYLLVFGYERLQVIDPLACVKR